MVTQELKQAIVALAQRTWIPRSVKIGMVAQWMHESASGASKLAEEQNNFAGIKWRSELSDVGAYPRLIQVPSEPQPVPFAAFRDPAHFVEGYLRFLERTPYLGWKNIPTGHSFISFLHKQGYAVDPSYVSKVAKYYEEAEKLLDNNSAPVVITWWELYRTEKIPVIVGWAGSIPVGKIQTNLTSDVISIFEDNQLSAKTFVVAPEKKEVPNVPLLQRSSLEQSEPEKKPGTNEPEKPEVVWKNTPNQSSRNGAQIKKIVLHYTTASSVSGTISWFGQARSRVSAHYLVGRDGDLYQFVADDRKAWHCGGGNTNTIGIENAAAPGQKLTQPQEQKLVDLLKWLLAEYKLTWSDVTGHRWMGNATSCPGSLWETEDQLKAWCKKHLS